RPSGRDADVAALRVPAKAGTHNHRRLLLRCASASAFDSPSTGSSALPPSSGRTAGLTQTRTAIEPREVAIPFFRRLRAHDGVAQAGLLACGMIDVLADRARHELDPRGAWKALRAIALQRRRLVVMRTEHVREAHRILHRLAGALREIL